MCIDRFIDSVNYISCAATFTEEIEITLLIKIPVAHRKSNPVLDLF